MARSKREMARVVRCWAGLAALGVFVIAGCGGDRFESVDDLPGTGSILASVQLTTSDGLTVTKVHVNVSPAGVTQDLLFDSATQQFSGLITTPPGIQTVTASAFSGSIVVGTGSGTATVAKHATATVVIKILDNASPTPPQPHGPIITSIAASTLTPMVGDTIDLHVTATDADGDPLTYAWSQNCTGNFSGQNTADTTWTTAVVQSCVITATVTSKGGLIDTAHVAISVQPSSGSVGLTATFIPLPHVAAVSLSGAGLSCTISYDATDASCRPAIPRSSVLTATVSFDPMPADSGGDLSLTDNCGGASSRTSLDLAGGSATFTWTAPGSTASCVLSATATRETLSDSEKVAVAVQ